MQPLALGEILREARERAGLTQSDLARRVGIAPNHLVRLESGEKVDPRWSTVVRLAAALGLSLDAIAVACGYRAQSHLCNASTAAAVKVSEELRGLIQSCRTTAESLLNIEAAAQASLKTIADEAGLSAPRKATRGTPAKRGRRRRS